MLAPLTGVSDVAFRRIAARFGAGHVVTEMVASGALVRGQAEALIKAEGRGLSPHVVQLVGRDPDLMAEAARLAQGSGADVIDLNFGCPAKRVTGGLAGSALMREPGRALVIVDAVLRAVSIPVTVKMRLGWDAVSLNAPDLLRDLTAAGAAAFTVHGRTRQQFYTGRADWSAVAGAVAVTHRPVLVNGDIIDLRSAREAVAASGASGAMIGRAAVGQPWIVAEIAAALDGRPFGSPSASARAEAAVEHYEALLSLYGLEIGRRCARKHLAAYADRARDDGFAVGELDRRELVVSDDPSRVVALLRAVYAEPTRLAA